MLQTKSVIFLFLSILSLNTLIFLLFHIHISISFSFLDSMQDYLKLSNFQFGIDYLEQV